MRLIGIGRVLFFFLSTNEQMRWGMGNWQAAPCACGSCAGKLGIGSPVKTSADYGEGWDWVPFRRNRLTESVKRPAVADHMKRAQRLVVARDSMGVKVRP